MKNLVLLISGKQGSGKTTLAKNLARRVMERQEPLHLNVWKFADPLYDMQWAISELLDEKYGTKIHTPDRLLLQVLGTEWGRSRSKDFWVRIMQSRIQKEIASPLSGTMPRLFLIDDARFPNEIDTFDGLASSDVIDVLKVRLEAPEHVRMGRAEKWGDTRHPSELALDSYPANQWDMLIFTDTMDADDACASVWMRMQEVLRG